MVKNVKIPTVNRERQMLLHRTIASIDLIDIEKPINEVAEYFLTLGKHYPYVHNLRLETYHDYDDLNISLVGDRLETDMELKGRVENEERLLRNYVANQNKKLKIAQEKENKVKKTILKEKKDRKKLYEELKKEFE